MVLPFRRKGSGKDDDEPVDQDIEDIMNEAEGLSEEEEPEVQEPVEEAVSYTHLTLPTNLCV